MSLPAARAEQQRIADCLSSLDDLIAAESEKLDALKTHKKGLMQQLFPSPEEVERMSRHVLPRPARTGAAPPRRSWQTKKFVLLYAYNGTGKTRLSTAFKDLGKQR